MISRLRGMALISLLIFISISSTLFVTSTQILNKCSQNLKKNASQIRKKLAFQEACELSLITLSIDLPFLKEIKPLEHGEVLSLCYSDNECISIYKPKMKVESNVTN